MTDRQKALQALEHCDLCSDMPNCHGCAYLREPACMENLKRDIIALLKAQEPREPHYTKLEYIVNGMPVAINHPECPRCYDNGLVLWDAEIEKGAAYCKRCGQAVKWE